MEIAMLDDDEFKRVSLLLYKGTQGSIRERMFGPLLREYEHITGFHEENPNAVYHHVLSIVWTALCELRQAAMDQRAKMCGACMRPRSEGNAS
jgi:hypothetical protein